MVGDLLNMLFRLKSVLPMRWFGDTTPVLDTLLLSLAANWTTLHSSLMYAKRQLRLMTATDAWLDQISEDYLGSRIPRRPGQSDDTFRRRISLELVRERGTRRAVQSVLRDLTGREPIIFEPAYCGDTGGYGSPSESSPGTSCEFAYGYAGGWGNLNLPFQVFVTAFRPVGNGIALLPGWCSFPSGYNTAASAYADLDMVQRGVTDDDIRAGVLSVLPAAVTAWVRIDS